MENQNKKMFRWMLGGGLVCILLVIPEIFIAELISKNNPDAYEFYAIGMLLITMFIYVIISVIKHIKYQKYAKNYHQERVEKAKKELTLQFKEVLLNYSEPIPKEYFKCQAKVDNDGKIICKIQLDYEVKIESYEKFLNHFHFNQD